MKNKIVTKIRKRDGSVVIFNKGKISEAVWKAARAVGGKDMEKAHQIAESVSAKLNEVYGEYGIPEVEEVQDLVEQTLIKKGHDQVAKAYILYRKSREELRDVRGLFDTIEAVEDYVGLNDWMVKENSNMDYSLQGLNNYIATKIITNYWMRRVYPEAIRKIHDSGDVHIHDLGTLGAYCFDDKTKILTENGWKLFKDVKENEKVATKNLKTGYLEFQVPYARQVYNYSKEMYSFEGRNVSLLVTPEHRLLVRRKHKKTWEFVQASEFKYGMEFDKQVKWSGKKPKHFEIPCVNGGNRKKKIGKLDIKDYLMFMGWYLSEGSIYEPLKGDFRISIAQSDKRYRNEILELLEKMNLKPNNQSEFNVHIHSKELYYHLKELGVSNTKYVPEFIKELDSELIEIFLNSLFKGDGSFYKGKLRRYFTKSKKLAEDVLECLLKINLCGTVWKRKDNGMYIVDVINNHLTPTYRKKVVKEKYRGKVYDFSVRNGTLVVMRNGKVVVSGNCVGWDLKDLLIVGFRGVKGKVESRPPKHLRTALGQIVNFFYTLQGETAGAQAFSNFDTLLAPFIRYDNMNYKEVKQCMQEFLFNLAVPTRVGFQTPFTNITMDLEVPGYMKDEHVVIGGQVQKETYKEFTKEMEMINRAFCECMLEGDASGRVFTFPIPTYNITKDFDWKNPSHDLVWEMTAKYGIPYFSNFVNSDMKPEDARSMCPLAGDEKVLIRSSRQRNLEYSEIRNLFKSNSKKQEYEIYSDGRFVKGKFNKFSDQEMIKVVLENGHEIKMSTEHLNFVANKFNGSEEIKKAKELTNEMYLPYSLNSYQGEGGNEELGFFVGAYAGDGSFDRETSVVFSLENHHKKELIRKLLYISEKYFGSHNSLIEHKKSKLVTLKIHSRAAVGLCKDFVEGIKREKCYKARLFAMSVEFRKGVLEGHYATDGGNRNRIYTSSKKMVETLNMLAATLGTTTSIYKDERRGRFGKEKNYAVLVYQLNRKDYGKIWFKKNNRLWMKIKEIKTIKNSTAYCFEVKNDEPVFTIGTTGVLTHNCRLRLDQKELRRRGGGLFGSNPQTGSIGVVTINMSRLGYVSTNEDDFFSRLDYLMELGKESLEIKRKTIERFTDVGLYPYSKFYLRQVHQRFGQYWKNHFSTIGLLGMNESIKNFMPGESIITPRGREFAIKILDFMRERLEGYQEETGNIYNLEATPGEGTTFRFARIDKKRFGRIVVANEEAYQNGASPYYTNSTQLPVNYTEDIFGALDLQDELQCKYTGGTVFHTFIGEKIDKEDVKKLVKKISSSYHLPYFTLSPTFSICPVHGYIAGEHEYCPKCDDDILLAEKQAQQNKMSVSDNDEIFEDEINLSDENDSLVVDSFIKKNQTDTGKRSMGFNDKFKLT